MSVYLNSEHECVGKKVFWPLLVHLLIQVSIAFNWQRCMLPLNQWHGLHARCQYYCRHFTTIPDSQFYSFGPSLLHLSNKALEICSFFTLNTFYSMPLPIKLQFNQLYPPSLTTHTYIQSHPFQNIHLVPLIITNKKSMPHIHA